jgi:hypothetical protein
MGKKGVHRAFVLRNVAERTSLLRSGLLTQ